MEIWKKWNQIGTKSMKFEYLEIHDKRLVYNALTYKSYYIHTSACIDSLEYEN